MFSCACVYLFGAEMRSPLLWLLGFSVVLTPVVLWLAVGSDPWRLTTAIVWLVLAVFSSGFVDEIGEASRLSFSRKTFGVVIHALASLVVSVVLGIVAAKLWQATSLSVADYCFIFSCVCLAVGVLWQSLSDPSTQRREWSSFSSGVFTSFGCILVFLPVLSPSTFADLFTKMSNTPELFLKLLARVLACEVLRWFAVCVLDGNTRVRPNVSAGVPKCEAFLAMLYIMLLILFALLPRDAKYSIDAAPLWPALLIAVQCLLLLVMFVKGMSSGPQQAPNHQPQLWLLVAAACVSSVLIFQANVNPLFKVNSGLSIFTALARVCFLTYIAPSEGRGACVLMAVHSLSFVLLSADVEVFFIRSGAMPLPLRDLREVFNSFCVACLRIWFQILLPLSGAFHIIVAIGLWEHYTDQQSERQRMNAGQPDPADAAVDRPASPINFNPPPFIPAAQAHTQQRVRSPIPRVHTPYQDLFGDALVDVDGSVRIVTPTASASPQRVQPKPQSESAPLLAVPARASGSRPPDPTREESDSPPSDLAISVYPPLRVPTARDPLLSPAPRRPVPMDDRDARWLSVGSTRLARVSPSSSDSREQTRRV